MTIVARSITPVGDEFTLRDYQIVNGCQTSHVLYFNRAAVTDQLFLPIKLIVTDSRELMNRVIKATNWQTEVKREAFIALEPFQKQIEEFYGSISILDQKLYYERRSKQYEADETPKFRVVSLTTQTKCFVAMFLGEPQSTHRYYGELLKSYNKSIFQDNHDPASYYWCAYAIFVIDRAFRRGELPNWAKPYRYHFLYLIRLYISPDDKASVERDNKKSRQYHENVRALLTDPSRFASFIREAVRTIDRVLRDSRGKYQGEAERRSEFTAAIRSELRREARSIGERTPDEAADTRTRPISRSSMRIRGSIKRVGTEFGFITDERGRDIFFHISQWRGARAPSVGIHVSFEAAIGQKGFRALAVSAEETEAPESVG